MVVEAAFTSLILGTTQKMRWEQAGCKSKTRLSLVLEAETAPTSLR